MGEFYIIVNTTPFVSLIQLILILIQAGIRLVREKIKGVEVHATESTISGRPRCFLEHLQNFLKINRLAEYGLDSRSGRLFFHEG